MLVAAALRFRRGGQSTAQARQKARDIDAALRPAGFSQDFAEPPLYSVRALPRFQVSVRLVTFGTAFATLSISRRGHSPGDPAERLRDWAYRSSLADEARQGLHVSPPRIRGTHSNSDIRRADALVAPP
jgi:hypothetical protein